MLKILKSMFRKNIGISLLTAILLGAVLLCFNLLADIFDMQKRCQIFTDSILKDKNIYAQQIMGQSDESTFINRLSDVSAIVKQFQKRIEADGREYKCVYFNKNYYYEHCGVKLKEGRYPKEYRQDGVVEITAPYGFGKVGDTIIGEINGKQAKLAVVGITDDSTRYINFFSSGNLRTSDSLFERFYDFDNDEYLIFASTNMFDYETSMLYASRNSLIVFDENITEKDNTENLNILRSNREIVSRAEVLRSNKTVNGYYMSILGALIVIFTIVSFLALFIALFLNIRYNERAMLIAETIGAPRSTAYVLNLCYTAVIIGVALTLFSIVYAVIGLFLEAVYFGWENTLICLGVGILAFCVCVAAIALSGDKFTAARLRKTV